MTASTSLQTAPCQLCSAPTSDLFCSTQCEVEAIAQALEFQRVILHLAHRTPDCTCLICHEFLGVSSS